MSNDVESSPKKYTTEAEMERRVSWVEARLREGPILKHTLLRRIKERYNISRATAEIAVSRARARLVLHLDELKKDHRATSLTVYEGIIADIKTSPGDKIRAREAVDRLLGLCAPAQSQVQ